eukprot:2772408-Pyramimonas_sp.AAC.1
MRGCTYTCFPARFGASRPVVVQGSRRVASRICRCSASLRICRRRISHAALECAQDQGRGGRRSARRAAWRFALRQIGAWAGAPWTIAPSVVFPPGSQPGP